MVPPGGCSLALTCACASPGIPAATGTPRCRCPLLLLGLQRCQMLGRSLEQGTAPASPWCAQVCPWHCHPSAGLAPCPSLSRAGTCSCASPCWLELLLDHSPSFSESLSALLPLWHQELRFPAQCFALGSPRWSLTNLLSLHSEYLQLLCWSIPKQTLHITGINQVKYQLFFPAPIKS